MATFEFLCLPRELRDRVYIFLLESEIQPPHVTGDISGRWMCYDKKWGHNDGIKFENEAIRISSLGLLRTNHQTATELREVIARRGGVTYKLDCTAHYNQLWPTWLSLPAPPQYLKDIEVDFRVLTYGNAQFVGYNGYRGPGRILTHLLQLLGGFFAYGPQFSKGREPPFPFCVDTITIIFWRSEDTENWVDTKKREDSLEGPIYNLKEWLEKLQLTGLLFGKVRRIRFCWDGMMNEWEVFDQRNTTLYTQDWAPYGWTLGRAVG
ncbi:hypothetical protein MMC32_005453 [Xylographa parallela]|nr:hypothetical protein [Xylographa parallela]